MNTIRRASIYKFPNYYIVHPDATTIAGYGTASGPYTKMPLDVDKLGLAKEVLTALERSKMNVSNADVNKDDSGDYAKSMGFKSYRKLQENAIYCAVDERNDTITFFPSVNTHGSNGFEFFADRKVVISTKASVEQVANAIESALSQSEQ